MDKLNELYNIVRNMRKELEEKEQEAYQKSKKENEIIYMIQAQEYRGAIRALEKVTDEIIDLMRE